MCSRRIYRIKPDDPNSAHATMTQTYEMSARRLAHEDRSGRHDDLDRFDVRAARLDRGVRSRSVAVAQGLALEHSTGARVAGRRCRTGPMPYIRSRFTDALFSRSKMILPPSLARTVSSMKNASGVEVSRKAL